MLPLEHFVVRLIIIRIVRRLEEILYETSIFNSSPQMTIDFQSYTFILTLLLCEGIMKAEIVVLALGKCTSSLDPRS